MPDPSDSSSTAPLDLETIRRAIAALPEQLRVAGDEEETPAANRTDGPLAVIARQGRLILRLSAATEAMEGRLKTLVENQAQEQQALREAREATHQAEAMTRQIVREAVLPLMDALEWAQEVAATRNDRALIDSLAAAARDGLRRLSAAGITEIPAPIGGTFDGRLHEAVEAQAAPLGSGIARYAVLAVVRRGYQRGTEVIRRTTVITAE